MQTDHAELSATETIHRAYQSLRPLLLSESSFRASVRALIKHTVSFERVRFVIERRTVRRCTSPAPASRTADAEPMISPAFDPWQVDLEELPRATRQLCVCPACEGAHERACAVCSAYERRVHTWLEVDRSERAEVYASPRELALTWHPAALDEQDFERAGVPHRLEHDEVLSAEQIAALPEHMQPALADNDRVVQARLQRLAVDVQEVELESALGAGEVALAGSPLAVYRVARAPWLRRNLGAACVGSLGALSTVIAVLSYRVQHPWFAKYGYSHAALGFGLAAALLSCLAAFGWLRARKARTALSTWWPSAGTIALACACVALLGAAEPTVQGARAALARGDLARALLTADALGALGAPASERTPLLDDIRLARMAVARTLDAQIGLAQSGPWSRVRQPAMTRALLGTVRPQAARARAANDIATLSHLSELVAAVLPGESHTLAVEAGELKLRTCIAQGEIECGERVLLELRTLGAVTARERALAELVGLVRARFERAFVAVSRSRTAQVELVNVGAALALARKLENLGAPLPRSLRMVLEHAWTRAERQVEAAQRIAQKPNPRAADPERRRASREEPRASLIASTRPRRW